ncbi:bifunctional phosphopantothenoylcysteine decarboxylase/phosphopantothenate--cysteine ligase CoaBC [Chitinophagaceae bacterium LB-8]|uniref:Coenzyme A biosynthesis bifunctional protein CoaBC n=1 Tax=Paraflavisolibacter caeni TaxID=2982496 RepID=A0A9X2XNJ5_9BACT|nr:bifunctional phosphopantothenoylcysteine decarboxylase/phosphopantothenate--cysteine ligase CoaBC [Paraflavisolibacter caeni]MCU7548384.1 bifunctional phosphopantothenoylcysteine decarboxylase/phosphopantothenate--cysteine ligase CoaBC [Paraflavisolibacter caeni]
MLKGKKIIIGITGSIAAYKSILIVRQLIKAGAEVKVIMTPAAKDFVSPLTLSTLSKNKVLIDLFNEDAWENHVFLGRWADLFLMAPLSCNTLGKMAQGLCDSLLMAVYLSATCPVMIAPAMDEDMWHHPSTRRNLQTLENDGCLLLPVEHGELASGLTGEGRMAEPETIIQFMSSFFQQKMQLKGKKALVTAGPTYEAIDPVRFIGNHSSGKMGYALAEELANRGAEVVLISGPVSLKPNSQNIQLIKVTAAEEMYNQCMKHAQDYDIAIMSAAVADYTPLQKAEEKIKKSSSELEIKLKKTKDILASLGNLKTDKQILVGFALETVDEEQYALKKLEEKNADMIILNSLKDEGAGFGKDTNKITLFKKGGEKMTYPTKSKELVAKDIVDSIIEMVHSIWPI